MKNLHAHARWGRIITINYKDMDFSEAVLDATDGRGVDVVLEHVGAATWEQSIASLAKNGRLVSCGVTTGNIGTIKYPKVVSETVIRNGFCPRDGNRTPHACPACGRREN